MPTASDPYVIERDYRDYLSEHLWEFFRKAGVNPDHHRGIIGAHGDKVRVTRYEWERAGVPFYHGTAIQLLSYCSPYTAEVGRTESGWVDSWKWVIDSYPRFKSMLAPLTEADLEEAAAWRKDHL